MQLQQKLSIFTFFMASTSIAYGAALDRSGQSIAAFLQPNNYAEVGFNVVDPKVTGVAVGRFEDYKISDMADSYYFPSAALKFQIAEKFSAGLIFDEAFGADSTYQTQDQKVSATGGLFFSEKDNTAAKVKSNNLSLLLGYQPTTNWNIYGGVAYQTFEASVQTRGLIYGGEAALGKYNANMEEDDSYGWIAGLAYQIPEIALKMSLTYRSEIEHSLVTREYGHSDILLTAGYSSADYDTLTNNKVVTPQSVNLDLQTGIAKNTTIFLNGRWVNWEGFTIKPEFFGRITEVLGQANLAPDNPHGFDLLKYKKDQYSATLGVARKFNEKWAGNINLGWDSGTGEYAPTLGPTKGNHSYGVGVQYSPQPNYFLAVGLKYIQIGNAKAQTAAAYGSEKYVANFQNNDGFAYGMKIGYRF